MYSPIPGVGEEQQGIDFQLGFAQIKREIVLWKWFSEKEIMNIEIIMYKFFDLG